MESEKVKEIKTALEEYIRQYSNFKGAELCKEALTLINELESENERIKNIGLNEEMTVGEYLREMERLKKDNELLRNTKVVYKNVDYCHEDLKKAEKRIAELEKVYDRQVRIINDLNIEVVKEQKKLPKFAERLKEDFIKKKNKLIKEREIAVKYDDFILIDALAYKIDELQYAIDNIDETLKEFL